VEKIKSVTDKPIKYLVVIARVPANVTIIPGHAFDEAP
jgi:hypothetical protein